MRQKTKKTDGWVRARRVVIAMVLVPVLQLMADKPLAWSAEPPDETLDCRVYDTRSASITVGFKAGNFLFEVGPEVTFGVAQGIAWDKIVQGLIARYVELCTRYNGGLVSEAEYEQRLREIEQLYREAQELERQLVAETHAHARSAHGELERMLGSKPQAVEPESVALKDSLAVLIGRIDQLEPIGRRLTPKTPCPTADMLGMPARSCD